MALPLATPEPAIGLYDQLVKELHGHSPLLAASACMLLLILAARPFVRPDDRPRLRFPLAAFTLCFFVVPICATLQQHAIEVAHTYVDLVIDLVFSYGVIAVMAFLLFDVFAHRVHHYRILRDVTVAGAGLLVTFVVLHHAGVNLLSIVTTSAILTAVIGLSLQDTLGNVVSGLAMQIEATMVPGDWIQVNDFKGQVTEIGWRSTVIVTTNDDLVVLPHSMLSKSVIINRSRPVPWTRRWVEFDVHLRHAPNEVQALVLESLLGLPNVKHDAPAPDCIFFRVEQDHAHYAVRYRLLDIRADDSTDSEVKKRIWYALRRSGVEIPYPSRNVFITKLSKSREEKKFSLECGRRVSSLRRIDLFGPLDEKELLHLSEHLRVELFADQERVIKQGAPGDSLYMICRGQASIVVEAEGQPKEVAMLGKDEFFGEMSLLTGAPRRATVVAHGDLECYVIDRALFQDVLGKREELVRQVTAILATRKSSLALAVAAMGPHHDDAAHHEALLSRVRHFFGLDS